MASNTRLGRPLTLIGAATAVVIAAIATILLWPGRAPDVAEDPPVSAEPSTTTRSSPEATEAAATTAAGDPDPFAVDYLARRDRYAAALLATPIASRNGRWAGLPASQAIALFDHAERTGDMSRIDEANELIHTELDAIDPNDATGALHHGGPLVLLTAYLRYADRPELLHPVTAERMKTGTHPDGTEDPDHSLVAYRDKVFAPYDVDGVGFDIERANPWDPRPTPDYNGTENHKLQILTAAMLLTEVYAGEEVGGRAVKDDTPEADDYWHYYRDSFLRYSDTWTAGYPTDHFGGDVSGEEKDASQYTAVYVQDYWLLRDLFSDPIIRAHAEILLDRVLIDMAEDTVQGMYTGPAGRYYTVLPSEGINQHVHVIDYLLFDSLGYEFPLDHAYRWAFGSWGYANMLVSDYGPHSPDFPRAVVDLATDKEDGYLVRNGRERHANWVEDDFALGFRVAGTTYGEGQSGGYYVADRAARGAGLAAVMFYGDTPFQKQRPGQTLDGIVDRRVAFVRNYHDGEQLKIWIKDGFDEVVLSPDGLYVRQTTVAGREVYLAVRPAAGGLGQAQEITDPDQVGIVVPVERNDDPLVWEVSTSAEHDSFEAFRADVADNPLEVNDDEVVYRSSGLEVELRFDRTDERKHTVAGTPIDWTDFDHGFQTPWSSNAYGSYEAQLDKGGHAVEYDWDPDGDGDFDEMPVKVVDGRTVFGEPEP